MNTLGQKMKEEFKLGAKLTDRQAKGRTGLITIFFYQIIFNSSYTEKNNYFLLYKQYKIYSISTKKCGYNTRKKKGSFSEN